MRQAEHVELALAPRPAESSIHEWMYSEIREGILEGRLKAGTRLPATRDLASYYQVSRGPVVIAYEQLSAEGYIHSRTGKGTFVTDAMPVNLPVKPRIAHADGSPAPGQLSQRGKRLAQSPFYHEDHQITAIPFRPNQPDFEHFPIKIWNRIASQRANALRPRGMGDQNAGGYWPLRTSIAEHLRYSQKIKCGPGQVMIVGSAQQALDICARLLLDVGDKVWMEDPGYPGASAVLQANEAQIVTVPVDEAGIQVSTAIMKAPDARLAYITAAHQSPVGATLSLERRLALLEWANQVQATIIEDDYDSEFRFEGIPLAPIKSLDHAGRVIYMGTFSKVLYPGIRLAYVVLPEWLQESFASALSLTCRYIGLHAQVVLSEFIAEGHYARHVRRMKLIYQERAEAFRDACHMILGTDFGVHPLTTGLDACVMLPNGMDDTLAANQLKLGGIVARPLSFYGIAGKPADGLMMGFSAFTPDVIRHGIQRVRKILDV